MNQEEIKVTAGTIISQIGGRGFALMVGLKTPIRYWYDKKREVVIVDLEFKAKAKENINYVEVVYVIARDTYDMIFGKVVKGEYFPIHTIEDVYCDQLATLFSDKTGLDVIPPTFSIG